MSRDLLSLVLVLKVALNNARDCNIDGHHVFDEHCNDLVTLVIVVFLERFQIVSLVIGLVGCVLTVDLGL